MTNVAGTHRVHPGALIAAMTNVAHNALSTLQNTGLRICFRNNSGVTAIAIKAGNSKKELASLPIEGGTFTIGDVMYNLVKTTTTGDLGAPGAWKLYTMTEVPTTIEGKIPMAASLSDSGDSDNADGGPSDQDINAMLASLFSGQGGSGEADPSNDAFDEYDSGSDPDGPIEAAAGAGAVKKSKR